MNPAHELIFDHLAAMTDDRGLFEHAQRTMPRVDHGYCTDDNARMLVITAREPDEGIAATLSRVALAFTLAAQTPDGRTRNRLSSSGEWSDPATTDDCWGRSLWGLGVAAANHHHPEVRATALAAFGRGVRQRSRWPRALAFAALGASDVLAKHPAHTDASNLLYEAVSAIGPPSGPPWRWPQQRLTYANAALAEATIAAGDALAETSLVDRGLTMLGWLLDRETRAGHLSVVGNHGTDPAATGPQFDQQPIEVATIADACWRAYTLTGQSRWRHGVTLAAEWFGGANDTNTVMWDDTTGGSFDGLQRIGVNLNQGAESTLALVSTMQRARTLKLDVS